MTANNVALFFTCLACTHAFGTTDGNAAIKYLRADVALRQAYPLEPAAAGMLEKALQSPLDQSDEKLVTAASDALAEFRRASAMATCDWELSVSDGVNADTSHRGAVRELVAVAGIRARISFHDGHKQEGLEDWLAADAAARHLSTDGTITSVLIGYKLEHEIFDILQPALGKFSRRELDFLADGGRRLPSGMTMQWAIAREKVDRNDLAVVTAAAKTRTDLVQTIATGIPILRGDAKKAEEIVDGCGGSVEGVQTCIREQSEFYAKWNSRLNELPPQFEADYNAEFLTASHDNPILADFTPSLARLRWAEAYNQTRMMLLRAAIGVLRDGANSLSGFPDPSTGEVFTYYRQAGGFRLQSQIKENGTPLSIQVQEAPPQ